MFRGELYTADSFSRHYHSHHHPQLIEGLPQTSTERSLLIKLLHLLLGLPFADDEQHVVLPHLTPLTTRSATEGFVECARQLQYLREQTLRMIRMSNTVLRALAEGIHAVLAKVENELSGVLRRVRQEQGDLPRSQLEYSGSRDSPVTILELSHTLRKHESLISYAVSVVSKLCLGDDPSAEQQERCVPLLMNLYHNECEEMFCGTGVGAQVHVLFKGVMLEYLTMCREWLEMEENVLLLKKDIGFFLRQEEVLSEQDKLFNLKKLIKQEMVPEMFKECHTKMAELGKTIQFIKLYFTPEQKQNYRLFMSLSQQFAPLVAYIQSLSPRPEERKSMFEPKPFKAVTISSRMAAQRYPKPIQTTPPYDDDPYGIFSKRIEFCHLRSDYTYPSPPIKQVQSTKSTTIIEAEAEEGVSVSMQVGRLLDQMLQRINVKCVNLLGRDRIRDSIGRTMKGIKKFMLFEQGDFIQSFLEVSQETLNRPTDRILVTRLDRFIQEAMKSSGAMNEPELVREQVGPKFLKVEHSTKGWRYFALVYRPQPPTNCIFTPQVMESYTYISHLLFNLCRCEEITVKIWRNYLTEGMGGILKARNAVHHFIKALQAYVFSLIEDFWSELVATIQQTGNVFQIIEANDNILSKLKELTIENTHLCNCMRSLVKVVETFEKIHKNLSEGEAETLRQDLININVQFGAILEESKKMSRFSDGFASNEDGWGMERPFS